jgi:hypothetical protein
VQQRGTDAGILKWGCLIEEEKQKNKSKMMKVRCFLRIVIAQRWHDRSVLS